MTNHHKILLSFTSLKHNLFHLFFILLGIMTNYPQYACHIQNFLMNLIFLFVLMKTYNE